MNLKELQIGLTLLMIVASVPVEAGKLSCSNATLKGTYIYNFSGIVKNQQYAEADMDVYDGKGNVVTQDTASNTNGVRVTETGKYVLNSDCSGKITYSGGEINSIYVNPNGDSLVYVLFDPKNPQTDVISGREERVSKGLLPINP